MMLPQFHKCRTMSERVIELVRTCPHDAQHQAALYAHVELIIMQVSKVGSVVCVHTQ
jgi:hypothetical protein